MLSKWGTGLGIKVEELSLASSQRGQALFCSCLLGLPSPTDTVCTQPSSQAVLYISQKEKWAFPLIRAVPYILGNACFNEVLMIFNQHLKGEEREVC